MDILIVDDGGGVRRAPSKALENAGFMVRAVANGLAALAQIKKLVATVRPVGQRPV